MKSKLEPLAMTPQVLRVSDVAARLVAQGKLEPVEGWWLVQAAQLDPEVTRHLLVSQIERLTQHARHHYARQCLREMRHNPQSIRALAQDFTMRNTPAADLQYTRNNAELAAALEHATLMNLDRMDWVIEARQEHDLAATLGI